MQLTRPQWIAAGVTAAVLIGGGVTMAVTGGGDSGTSDDASGKPGLADAQAVADALKHLADDPDSLVAADVRSAVGTKARRALPEGSTVSANPASWQPDGLGGGTMTVTVTPPGQPATTYTAIMVKEQSGWKVLGTMPMAPSNAGTSPADPGQAPAANPPGVAGVPPGGATVPAAGAGVVPPGGVTAVPPGTAPGTAPGAAPGTTAGTPAQQPAPQQPAPAATGGNQ
jgi:hypothetical protein